MDEMIKQAGEIDEALAKVGQERDMLLSRAPMLSPSREAVLNEFLAGEFPLEAAFRQTAAKRDQLLSFHPPRIPASAEATLRQFMATEPRHQRASEWRGNAPVWLRLFRSPLGTVLLVCAIITAGILCFGRWDSSSPRNAENSAQRLQTERVNIKPGVISERSPLERTELFIRKASIGPFNLGTSEPASLQASFLANGSLHFADGIETPLGLRFELPVRASLTDDGLARTP